MFSYPLYKLLHVIGVLMVFAALGGVIVQVLNKAGRDFVYRKQAAITHGIGLFLILLGGFGALARLGIGWPWPGWVYVKVVIWILLGGATTLIIRKPEAGRMYWALTLILGALAAYMAIFKPF